MAITNSAISSFESGAIPNLASQKGQSQFQSVGNALSGAGQQTTTLALPASLTFSRGIVRTKVYSPGSADVAVAIVITGTDGTNSQIILSAPAIGYGAGTAWDVDYLTEWISEFNLNSFSVLTTLTGTTKTATLDFEVFGVM